MSGLGKDEVRFHCQVDPPSPRKKSLNLGNETPERV